MEFDAVTDYESHDTDDNHVAVEFDAVTDYESHDTDDNHVAVDVNSLISNMSATAAFMNESGLYQEFDLNAEKSIRCWIDFDGEVNSLNVSVVPRGLTRPKLPLISIHLDLLGVVEEFMYVSFLPPEGFSPVHRIWIFQTFQQFWYQSLSIC
ncbi:hypothetical protein SUGI_0243610 [Cryptomeria japonica]|nr:hypothetical protein SUGI_0243610 [Cryptomeria japonica]